MNRILYVDSYSSIARACRRQGRKKLPHTISVDASFPFGIDTGGLTMVHVPINLAITSMAIDLAKLTNLAVAMQIMALYLRQLDIFRPSLNCNDLEVIWLIIQAEEWLVNKCNQASDIRR